jgi:16S rRNA (guanine(966)-N(2))-methyltransferase RsmD
MRIISGTLKSRKLLAPKGDTTRPTSDRARESLFNVLSNLVDFEDMTVLDLFAGSGAFAFEAVSRGAGKATLVEENRKVIETIKENARALAVEEQMEIIQKDVYQWLNQSSDSQTIEGRGSTTGVPFDLIFADPPYDDSRTLNALPAAIFAAGLLTAGSLVIVEHRTGSKIGIPENAELFRELSAGEAVFSFLRQK